jgi:hypothetical protein
MYAEGASQPLISRPPHWGGCYAQHERLKIWLISLKTRGIPKPYPQQNRPFSPPLSFACVKNSTRIAFRPFRSPLFTQPGQRFAVPSGCLIDTSTIRNAPNPFVCNTASRSNRQKSKIFSPYFSNTRRTNTKVSRSCFSFRSAGFQPAVYRASSVLIDNMIIRIWLKSFAFSTNSISNRQYLGGVSNLSISLVSDARVAFCFEPLTSDLESLLNSSRYTSRLEFSVSYRKQSYVKFLPETAAGHSGPLPIPRPRIPSHESRFTDRQSRRLAPEAYNRRKAWLRLAPCRT